MKLGLATRGKWTLEHDVSQDIYIYIYIHMYIHICKSEVSKTYTIVNVLFFLYFVDIAPWWARHAYFGLPFGRPGLFFYIASW